MNLATTEVAKDSSIKIVLDSGQAIYLTKEQAMAARFVGYQCTHCRKTTTLAGGKCGHCGDAFEPRSIDEVETLETLDGIDENDWERLVFLLTHRGWVCHYCRCSNANYPREGSHEGVSCIHCGNHFTEGKDILMPDGDIVIAGGDSTVESLKRNIMGRFHKHRENQRSGGTGLEGGNFSNLLEKRNMIENASSAILGSKWKILASTFGAGFIAWALYYGLIQEHAVQVIVDEQKWTREIDIEKYVSQQGDGWQKDVNPASYDHFEIVSMMMREAPWDSYQVQIGTRNVTDNSICLRMQETCHKTKVAVSGGAIVDGPEQCSSSCAEHGTKSEPVMETRHHSHPYIHFRYMDWKVDKTLKTSGDGINAHWANTANYRFDNTTIRMGDHRQNYALGLSGDEGEKEVVQNIPYEAWRKIRPGVTCSATATRWGGIKGSGINWENDCQK